MSTVSVIYELIGRDSASPAFNKAGESATRLEKTVSAASKAIVVAGTAIAAGAVAVGTESVKMAVSFQSSMEKIHTQAGASQGAVDSLTKSVLQLAPSTQQGPEQLSEALYHLKSVGMDNADAMKALKTASDLAAVGGANLEDTTNALAGAWRSGIKGAQSFGETAATTNAIIGAGNMKMSDFTAAMGTGILPAAKTFGVSLKSVGAALALMTDEGVPANDAATRLRMSLSLMGAPSAQASKALSTIGLSGTQLATAMRSKGGLVAAIQLLHDHLQSSGLTAVQSAQVISEAFGGGRSSSAIMTMLNNLQVLKNKQDQINKSTGNYGSSVAAQRQTAQAQFKILESAADTLGIKLGLALLPPLTAFVKYLAQHAVPAVASFATAVGRIIPVGTIKKDYDQLESWIGNLTGKKKPAPVKVPVKPEIATPDSSLFVPKKPLQVQVPVKPTMKPDSSLFVPKPAKPMPPDASLFVPKKSDVTKSLGKSLDAMNYGQIAGKIGMSLISAIFDSLGKVDWASAGGKSAAGILEFVIGLASELLDPVTWWHVLQKSWLQILGLLLTVITIPFGGEGGTVFKVIADVLEHFPILKAFAGLFRGIDSLLAPLAKAWRSLLGKVFGPVLDIIGGFFKDVGSWLLGKGESIILGLWYGAEDAWGSVTKWLGKLGSLLLKPFAKAGSWLLSKGEALLSGFLEGQKDQWSAVLSWLGKIGGWIGDKFAKAGSWLVSHGRQILTGLWNGTKAVWSDVSGWFGKIGGWIGSAFAKAGSWLVSKGRQVITGLWNGQKAEWSAALSWLRQIGGRIVSVFAKAGSWLVGHGRDIISGLKSGMSKVISGIGSWIKTHVVDPVVNAVKKFFGIHSPSTVMAELGGNLMSGLFKGLMSGDLTGMIKTVFGSMPDALGAIVEKGLVSVSNLPSKALSALGDALGSGASWLSGLLGKFTGGGGGNAANQVLGKAMAAAAGWTGSQWTALQALWTRESGWNTTARNPSSGAYGIPQSLPASKMASAGGDWLTNAATQIKWGLEYIAATYGSPAAAWAHETSAGWYAKGTPGTGAKPGWAWVGEQGRELVDFSGGETVLSHGDSMRAVARGLPGYASGTKPAAEVKRGETVADTYLSGAVTTLAKIASEQSAAVKAIQSYYSGRPAAWAENVVANQSKHLTTLVDKLSTLTSQHNAAVSYQSSVTSDLSDTGALSGLTVDPYQSGGGLSSQLQSKLASLKKFSAAIGQLKKAGLSNDLLQQIVAMGPDDGLTYAQAMLSGGTKVIGQLNTAESAVSTAAGGVANAATVAVYGNAVVSGFSKQQAALQKQMKSLGATMGKEVAKWLGVPKSKLPHYGHGGTFGAGELMVTGDRGPELAVFGQPGRILSPEQSAAAVGGDGASAGPLVGVLNVNHVPGFTTGKDIENALQSAARQARVARRQ